MFQFIIRGLQWAAPALAGYFLNDIGDGVSKVLPENVRSKVKDEQGNWKPWFVISVLAVAGAVLMMVFKKFAGGKKGRGLFALATTAAVAADYFTGGALFGNDGGYVMATALVTLTTGAGVVTSVNLSFLPERLAYAAATQLSGVKVTVQGDGVIFDSDANGLTHIGVNRVIGQVTNNYILTLSNSLIKGKNVLFEFTNSAAQTPTVYYDSDSTSTGNAGDEPLFCQMMKVPLLVGGNDFSDFATLSLPSLAATDTLTITYRDGTTQSGITRADLQYKLGYTQATVNTPIYQIDNFAQTIKSVTVIAGSSQTGYLQRWAPSVSRASIAGQA